jgi:hypothetical protein
MQHRAQSHSHARRRAAVVVAALAVLGSAGIASGTALAGTDPQPTAALAQDFTLRWDADPATDGLNAFVGIEDDRSDSHPGVQHIFAESSQYRFVMHKRDRDGSDRQRQEVRAIAENGTRVDMHKNQTWRYNYQMYIPSSLKGTTSFTHIFQVKQNSVADPLVTMSLTRSGSTERIEMRMYADGGDKVGTTNLASLKNKWLDVEIEIKVADGSAGRLRYSIKDGSTTVVNASRSGDTWISGDEAHPKWGIYRSIKDSGQLQDTYLLLRNMRAYQGV